MRCAAGAAGAAGTPASSSRAAPAVPFTSWRSTASCARPTARRISQRRAPSSGSSAMSSPRTSRSMTRFHTVSSKTASRISPSTYWIASPAVARSPIDVGLKGTPPASMSGLDAASTRQWTCSPPATGEPTRTYALRGWRPLTGVPSGRWTRPSHWKPGVRGVNPRSSTASTVRPAHSAGTVPVTLNQLVPHGRPHGVPGAMGVVGAFSPSAPRGRVRPRWTRSPRPEVW